MKKTLVIAKRELTCLFYSPVGYLALGMIALVAGIVFLASFRTTVPANDPIRVAYATIVWLLVFIAPAISMRVLSGEYQSGTFELLMTSPTSDAQVVIGKWLGATGFLAALLSPLLVLLILLETKADPDYGPILTGLLGILLVGSLYLSMGCLASAFTRHQILAYLGALFMIGLFTLIPNLFLILDSAVLRPLSAMMPGWFLGATDRIAAVATNIDISTRFQNMNLGVIEVPDLTFFLSGIVLFLFLTVKLVESKRWR